MRSAGRRCVAFSHAANHRGGFSKQNKLFSICSYGNQTSDVSVGQTGGRGLDPGYNWEVTLLPQVKAFFPFNAASVANWQTPHKQRRAKTKV